MMKLTTVILALTTLASLTLTGCMAYDRYVTTSANVSYYGQSVSGYRQPHSSAPIPIVMPYEQTPPPGHNYRLPQAGPGYISPAYYVNQPVREGRDWVVSESHPMAVTSVYPELNR